MRHVGLIVALLALAGCVAPDPDRPVRVREARIDDKAAARGEGLLRRTMIEEHNAARAAAGALPLVWNDTLAADAARYADVLAETGEYKHSVEPRGAQPEGETLFKGTRGAYRYDEMVRLWVAERRFYQAFPVPDISTTGRWQDVAHYTQIVWQRTTEVGCALASSRSDDYLVCRYSPPGNVYARRAEE